MHYFVKGYYEPPEDTEHDKRVYFPTNEQCERLFQKAWSPWCLKFSTIINEFVIIFTLFILNWACFRLLLSRPPFFVPKVDDVLHPQIILYLVDKVLSFHTCFIAFTLKFVSLSPYLGKGSLSQSTTQAVPSLNADVNIFFRNCSVWSLSSSVSHFSNALCTYSLKTTMKTKDSKISMPKKLFKQIKDKRKTKKPFLTKDILLVIFFNIKGEKHETNAKTLVFASPRYLHINNSLIWCKYYHWLVLSSRLQRLTQMFASKCQQNLNNCILLQNGR